MLVHIDNGLMAVVQECFPDKHIGKFDMLKQEWFRKTLERTELEEEDNK